LPRPLKVTGNGADEKTIGQHAATSPQQKLSLLLEDDSHSRGLRGEIKEFGDQR